MVSRVVQFRFMLILTIATAYKQGTTVAMTMMMSNENEEEDMIFV